MRTSRLKRLLLVMGGLVLGLSLCETLVLSFFWWPSLVRHLPSRLHDVLRTMYMQHDRPIVQYDPACAQYDPELFYTLRPGRCVFSSREFSTELRINRLGVRDDEEALRAPEIVVLGDSFAMGWGVDRAASFPALLGKLTGYRVLDAAVSSYGTVREFKLLDRVDLSHVKFIVIQYDMNDDFENLEFLAKHNVLKIESEQLYQSIVKHEPSRRRYYWGQYFFALLAGVISPAQAAPREPDPASAGTAFLNAVEHASRQSLDGVHVIALSCTPDPTFFQSVDTLRREPAHPDFIHNLELLDLSERLTADDYYYLLDDHLNPAGQAMVARALAERIGTNLAKLEERVAGSEVDTAYNLDSLDGQGFGSPVILHSTAGHGWKLRGWAVDGAARKPARGVVLLVDGRSEVRPRYGVPRSDVAASRGQPDYLASGFEVELGALPRGRHRISVLILSADGRAYYRTKGEWTFEVR